MVAVGMLEGETLVGFFADEATGAAPSKVFRGVFSLVGKILDASFGDATVPERFFGVTGAFLVGAGPRTSLPLAALLPLRPRDPTPWMSPCDSRSVPTRDPRLPERLGLAVDTDTFLGLWEVTEASEETLDRRGDLMLPLFSDSRDLIWVWLPSLEGADKSWAAFLRLAKIAGLARPG